ncbi:MAG: ribonuclease [Acidimicrobiales bacterium]|nr:ribonuclease [Acidimicrobiales bacterium]
MAVFVAGYFVGNLNDSDDSTVGGGAFGTTIVVEAPSASPNTIPNQPSSGKFIQYSELPSVLVTKLPAEAWDTLELIAGDGPFPYDRDGLTFQNREGILPDLERGHYREYTVRTPGESDRGARRIVAGAHGELYYTDDHYASFREIIYAD